MSSHQPFSSVMCRALRPRRLSQWATSTPPGGGNAPARFRVIVVVGLIDVHRRCVFRDSLQ
eukprot:11934368-Alexandrium_andersonii.AAC.1